VRQIKQFGAKRLMSMFANQQWFLVGVRNWSMQLMIPEKLTDDQPRQSYMLCIRLVHRQWRKDVRAAASQDSLNTTLSNVSYFLLTFPTQTFRNTVDNWLWWVKRALICICDYITFYYEYSEICKWESYRKQANYLISAVI